MNSNLRVVAVLGILLPAVAHGDDGTALGSIHRLDGSPYRQMAARKRDASPYHNGPTLYCSDCHVMHASLQHNYAGGEENEGGTGPYPWSTEPAAALLKAQDPVDLCLNCHDNAPGIPDVLGSDINNLRERSAGFFDHVEIPNPRGHDLGRGLSGQEDSGLCTRCHSGSDDGLKVTCIDCHAYHGNGNPRNLQWASWPDGTPPLGLFNPAGMSDIRRFERGNTNYGTLDGMNMLEASSVCVDCHHVFSGGQYTDPEGTGFHVRHPTYDSERDDPNSIEDGQARGSTAPAHWEGGSGSGFEGTQRVPCVVRGAADYASASVIDASTNGVFCLSCHKAHGSSSAFGIVWPLNGAIDRTGCDQCHRVAPGGDEGDPTSSVEDPLGKR